MEGIQDKENDAILFRKLEGLRQETRTLNDNSDRFHQDTQDLIKETQKLQMLFNALTRELETFRQECMESEKSDKNTEK